MLYDLVTFSVLLFFALLIGMGVGWSTYSQNPREGWLVGWIKWALLAFVVGLIVALLKLLPGRIGFWLEVALLMTFAYTVGCFLGGWLKTSVETTFASATKNADSDVVAGSQSGVEAEADQEATAAAERRAAEVASKAEAERLAAEAATKAEGEPVAGETATEAEAQRHTAKVAAKAEGERLAAEDTAKAEAERVAAETESERLTAEAAAKAGADRVAVPAAAKAKAQLPRAEAASRAEAERLAAEDTAKAEAERVAVETESERLTAEAAAERLAAQAAAKAEGERSAGEDAARAEAERIAAPAAAKAEAGRPGAEAATRTEAERLAAEASCKVEAAGVAAEASVKAEPERIAADAAPKEVAMSEMAAAYPGVMPSTLAAPNAAADDLKLVKGIGPKNERILNALGVYHFAQIAVWSPENAAWMGYHMAFPGRIEREQWAAQAKMLAAGLDTEHSAAVKSGAIAIDDAPLGEAEANALAESLPALMPRVESEDKHAGSRPLGLDVPRGGTPDDLKMIKGIGKQNEERLHALGVWHFDQVAGWSPENVKWVGSYLSFSGRIDREKWVAQAKDLAAGLKTEFARRVEAGPGKDVA
jgi:predicted flap endonuclease-1-like 5' DNA nuclease